jgi:hypothetical protein
MAISNSFGESVIGPVGPVKWGLGSRSGFILRAWDLRAWPGLQARGLDCGLSPKTGPCRLRLFIYVVKSRMLGSGLARSGPNLLASGSANTC